MTELQFFLAWCVVGGLLAAFVPLDYGQAVIDNWRQYPLWRRGVIEKAMSR